jgi:peroxiredoxin
MKRFLKYMIGICLLAIGCWLATRTYQSYQSKKESENRIQTLQHCCFESLTGRQICVDEFDTRKPTVIIYFNPECEHCQYEASEIGKQAERFEKANMILITPDDSTKRVEAFATKYHLWEVDNLTILIDRDHRFKNYFGTSVFPSVFIYGPDKKLLKMYKGEVKIEAIINSLPPTPSERGGENLIP